MHHVLCGLAANAALPSELVDRLIAVADTDVSDSLASRTGLSHAQAVALASQAEEIAVRLAYEGLLTAADIDPVAQPRAALALLEERSGDLEWALLFASDPDAGRRETVLISWASVRGNRWLGWVPVSYRHRSGRRGASVVTISVGHGQRAGEFSVAGEHDELRYLSRCANRHFMACFRGR